MPLNSSTLITASNPKTEIEPSADYSPLMLLPVAAAVAFHYSKKQMRKAKRKMVWQFMKAKLKSLFSFKKGEGKKLGLKILLILLGLAFIIGIGVSLGWSIAITILIVGGLMALVMAGKD